MGLTTDRIYVVAMDKFEALGLIKEAWDKNDISLEEKILQISNAFYSVGLDIATTATYIKATPAEFDVFLSLSNLDDNMIREISKANPPKTTWLLLASGSDDEIQKALAALSDSSRSKNETVSEFVYQQMIEVAGETPDHVLARLTGNELFYLAKKAKDFNSVDAKKIKFLNSVAGQKKRGKPMTEKQIDYLKLILNDLADNRVIQRNSIDGDSELCDKVLDAIDR